jgi:hypothetical protein
MDRYLLPLFIANGVLVLVDASLGYHVAPLLVRRQTAASGEEPLSAAGVRRLLAVMVALYMFLSCLAYFHGHGLFLLVITGIVVVDIIAQLVIRWRLGKHTGP